VLREQREVHPGRVCARAERMRTAWPHLACHADDRTRSACIADENSGSKRAGHLVAALPNTQRLQALRTFLHFLTSSAGARLNAGLLAPREPLERADLARAGGDIEEVRCALTVYSRQPGDNLAEAHRATRESRSARSRYACEMRSVPLATLMGRASGSHVPMAGGAPSGLEHSESLCSLGSREVASRRVEWTDPIAWSAKSDNHTLWKELPRRKLPGGFRTC